MSKTFGFVRVIPEGVEESREIPFILSTSDRDRYHTVLNQENWNLENFRKNPVIGYMHNLYGDLCNPPDPDDVIGADHKTIIEEIDGRKTLTGLGYFNTRENNLKADKVFRNIVLGFLRATSVGFSEIGKGSWGENSQMKGGPDETYYFVGQELLEWSVVNIPGNAAAGKRNLQFMRENTFSAITYAFSELGKKFTLSQIEQMRVCDVLTLLSGKDLELRETDPDKVRKMLHEEQAKKDEAELIENQQIKIREKLIAVKA